MRFHETETCFEHGFSFCNSRIQEMAARFANCRVLADRRLYDAGERDVIVDLADGKIMGVCPGTSAVEAEEDERSAKKAKIGTTTTTTVIDGRGAILAPGFIDMQFNGGWGVAFTSATLTEASVHEVSRQLARVGVTSYMATVVTATQEVYKHSVSVLTAAREKAQQGGETRSSNSSSNGG